MTTAPRNERILYIRKAMGLTQEQFAALLGFHRVTLAKLERGHEPGELVALKVDAFINDYDEKNRRAS